jgi:hypothetical protein
MIFANENLFLEGDFNKTEPPNRAKRGILAK